MVHSKDNPQISVGILKSKNIDFELKGNFYINTKKYTGKGHAVFENNSIRLTINNEPSFTTKQLIIKPDNIDTCSFELKNVIIGINFHWEQKENQVFQGALKLIINNSQIHAINVLPLENYLTSVISSEMNATSSLSLLQAHAVISRSWLLAQIQKQSQLSENKTTYSSEQLSENEVIKWYDREDHTHFHVCADDHCQRYQGITRAQNSNVVKAVNNTAGLVLTYNNSICDARFSKCCGGVSELFENCWEPIHHDYLTKVVDVENEIKEQNIDLKIENNARNFIHSKPKTFCNTNDEHILAQVLNSYDHSAKDFFRWEVEYSQHDLSELIKKKSGINFGIIENLVAIERGESGRLIKLKIFGSKKTLTIGKELEIRRYLSESHLYSSAFTVEKIYKNSNTQSYFVIKGAGWGHGVGLCQIGAAVMGEKGYTYEQILKHYYKGALIEKKY